MGEAWMQYGWGNIGDEAALSEMAAKRHECSAAFCQVRFERKV
jgi:polysaccharide pyruvyl transferase WcaK-like protein